MNYYNDFDKGATQWLRNLVKAGLLPPGDVDDHEHVVLRHLRRNPGVSG